MSVATVNQLAGYIGQAGLWNIGKVQVPVKVDDARVSWGYLQFLVSPVGGVGQVWIGASAVDLTTRIY